MANAHVFAIRTPHVQASLLMAIIIIVLTIKGYSADLNVLLFRREFKMGHFCEISLYFKNCNESDPF